MQIILMRHGEAVPFAPTDAERALTPKGLGEARQSANQLRMAGFVPKRIWVSSRLRAQQTAEQVRTVFAQDEVPQVLDGITPEDPWASAMMVLERNVRDGDLVVFHQPILMSIVASLITGDAGGYVEPNAVPAAAYVLSLEAFVPGTATLVAAYTP